MMEESEPPPDDGRPKRKRMEDYSKNDLVAHLKEALKQLRENEKKNAELVESRDTLLAKTQGLLAKFKQSQQRVQDLEEEDRTKSEQSSTMVAKMKSLFEKLKQTDKARADAVQAAAQAEAKERALAEQLQTTAAELSDARAQHASSLAELDSTRSAHGEEQPASEQLSRLGMMMGQNSDSETVGKQNA